MKRHLPALLLACLIGLLMISSQLMFRLWIGDGYRGIAPILSPATQDSAWYHAVIKETMEGGKPWNAILAEQKDATYPVADLAERSMVFPGRIFPMGPDALLTVWRFVLPALLAFVLYATGIVLTRSRMFAVVSTVFTICFSYAVYASTLVISILRGTGKALLYTIYDRPVHPQFEAPLLWGFLILIVLATTRPERKHLWIGAGILLGILTHTYVWAWTWGYVALAVLLVQSFIQNDRRAAGAVLKSWLFAFIVGLPSLIPLVRSFLTPSDALYAERLALLHGHLFAATRFNAPIVIALAVLVLSRRYLTPSVFRFGLSGLAATFISMNQQVLTGISFQPDHYMSTVGASMVLWVLAWAAWVRLEREPRRIRILASASVMVASVILMMGLQFRIFEQSREYAKDLQPFADVAVWLNAHADRESVVFTNQQIGLLIPVYTSSNLWWHFYALGVPVERARIEHAAFTWFMLQGLTGQDLRTAARVQPVDLTQYFTLTTIYEQRIEFLRSNLDRLITAYEAFRAQVRLADALRRTRVDFVLFDKQLDTWDPTRLEVGETLVENDRFVLYRAIQKTN